MDPSRRRRLARATAAAALAAAAVALSALTLSPTHAGANPTVIIAIKTPTTLKGLEAAARAQRSQMAHLEAQMQVIHTRYDAAAARLTGVNQQLSDTRLQLAQSQEALDRSNAVIGARLAAMYKMGSFSIIDVLAGSASFTQAQAQITFFRLLAEQDRQADDGLARLNSQVGRLASSLSAERTEAQSAQSVVDEQRLAMSDKIAERRAILETLTRRIQSILDKNNPNGLVSPVPLSGHYTPLTWAKALLEQLGMPLTQQNVAAIVAWEMAEGGHWHNTAYYNPLDTTMPEPGATSMNSVGVKAYVSWAQGFRATIATLRNGYYGRILAALRAGDNAIAVADAVAASPWGTGNFASLL